MRKSTRYDLIIRNGLLVDPGQGIHEKKDIAILNGKVAAIGDGIASTQALKTIDASDMIVAPGLVDIHTHCSFGIVHLAINPDSICLARGTTTALDAGSLGHLQFPALREYVIDKWKTGIYALLNIESLGMVEFGKNDRWPELITGQDEIFINVDDTVKMIEENRDLVLGVKWAHHGLSGVKLAREASDRAGCMLMAENHIQPETLRYLKKGDVVTHLYHGLRHHKQRLHDGLLNEEMRIQPEFYDAVRRGVIMDLGHGRGSFSWEVAETALEQGLKPDTISTDLHVGNFNGPVYDMPTTMSKLLLLGMSLEEVIEASTARPAEVLDKHGKIGTLAPGANADVTIMRLEKGRFTLMDTMDKGRIAAEKLTLIRVVHDGVEFQPILPSATG